MRTLADWYPLLISAAVSAVITWFIGWGRHLCDKNVKWKHALGIILIGLCWLGISIGIFCALAIIDIRSLAESLGAGTLSPGGLHPSEVVFSCVAALGVVLTGLGIAQIKIESEQIKRLNGHLWAIIGIAVIFLSAKLWFDWNDAQTKRPKPLASDTRYP